ncbi:unnamed protein product, partial [Ectocarpus fasciculatus]
PAPIIVFPGASWPKLWQKSTDTRPKKFSHGTLELIVFAHHLKSAPPHHRGSFAERPSATTPAPTIVFLAASWPKLRQESWYTRTYFFVHHLKSALKDHSSQLSCRAKSPKSPVSPCAHKFSKPNSTIHK